MAVAVASMAAVVVMDAGKRMKDEAVESDRLFC
jgi:hypothetical protein